MKDEDKKVKFPAVISYVASDGKTVSINAKGKLRGQRSLGCAFPKFKLEVLKEELPKAKDLAGADKLKFGTHCEDEEGFDQFGGYHGEKKSYREAFLYRAAAILVLPMARARPALITYVDSSDKNSSITRQAFFYEDTELLAKRMDGKEIKELEG